MSDEIPKGAKCKICGGSARIGRAVRVQPIEDEDGNPITDGEITYFHKRCLESR